MKFTLEINCDNAAFENAEEEIARILQETAEKVECGRRDGVLFDYNGNRVGQFVLTEGGDE